MIVEVLAPYSPHTRNAKFIYAPPQAVHLFHEGRLIGPHVLGYNYRLDMDTLKRIYEPDPTKVAAAALLLPGRQVQVLGPAARAASIWSARPRAAPCS